MICKKKITILIIFLSFFSKIVYSEENKILIKVNNEIITSQDILDHIDYLTLLNPDLSKLNKEKKIKISKNSLIKEKIKKIEISSKFEEIKIEDKYIIETLKSIYVKLGFKSLEEFNFFLINKKINLDEIKKKLIIETLWNQLIFLKFSSRVKINKEEIKQNIKNQNFKKKIYLLSEIIFNVKTTSDVNKKYELIKKVINSNGFENAALTYSISESAKIGGKLGWINEGSINRKISKEISSLHVNEITKPIVIPSGFLILKVNDIKEENVNVDINKELEKIINNKKNDQLNQFSNIYFEKIKTNILINEL